MHHITLLEFALAGLLPLTPPAFAQQPGTSILEVDAAASAVRIDVDPTARVQLSGARFEHVRIDTTPPSAGDAGDCPIQLYQDGDTIEINVPASDGCQGVDLQVTVPRRFDALLDAPRAREVIVRQMDGRVTGQVSPELECRFRSFRGSTTCAGGHFDVRFSQGKFVMRAQE